MSAVLIRNWPVVVAVVTLILGSGFGYLVRLLQDRRAYDHGYTAGYSAHTRLIAEAYARIRARHKTPAAGTDTTRLLPASATTVITPAPRRTR